jgi:hypothetical protein
MWGKRLQLKEKTCIINKEEQGKTKAVGWKCKYERPM